MRSAVLVIPLAGCLALGPKPPPPTRRAVVVGSIGAAAAAGALVAAQQSHGASGKAIAAEAAFGIGGGFVPALALYSGEEPESPTTEGGIYMALGSGLLSAFGAAFTLPVPALTTYGAGQDVEGSRYPQRAFTGAFLGTTLGMVASLAIHKHVPKWARIALGAALMGSFSTLGYQIGGRGAEPR